MEWSALALWGGASLAALWRLEAALDILAVGVWPVVGALVTAVGLGSWLFYMASNAAWLGWIAVGTGAGAAGVGLAEHLQRRRSPRSWFLGPVSVMALTCSALTMVR